MALNPFPMPAVEPGAGFACWSESIELNTTAAQLEQALTSLT